jgi:Nif-specific regulatory protein
VIFVRQNCRNFVSICYHLLSIMTSPSKRVDSLGLLAEVNRSFSSSKDAGAAIRSALDLIRENTSVARLFVALLEPDGNSLNLHSASGFDAATFRKLDGRIARTAPVELIDPGASSVRVPARDLFEGITENAGQVLVVRVGSGGSSFGLLAAAPVSDGDEERLIEMLASMIGQSLRVEHAVRGERQKLREENIQLKHELKERYDFSHIVGNSNAIRQVYDQVTQVARSNATVLLRGESGTGKEMIANAIHYNSLRSKRPLVKVNCAALPDTLIESELFGHEKGAFTGAERFKKGRFEIAEGGTLFLDEIGDIPLQTQIKLLRVLQEREFERVGGTDTIKANIRLIVATNKNLEEAIGKGEFREDLYYRLNVFSIFLPPLRERHSDVLLLAEHFLEKYEIEHGKRIRRISTPAIDMLMSYHFPGNVRELENAIERAVLVCDTNVIHSHHLPPTLQTAENTGTVTDLSLESAVANFERGMIQDALKSNRGSVAKAARSLGSTERIIGYKVKKYGIDPARFKR